MPQIKNLGMPMAGPVPAMPPSPAGLPQNKPGPTAVTQTEPEPDDLTKIFNSYTSGQIDRNSLIEQLRNISSGRGGILALLETMEGKAQPEAAGDFAPVPAAAPPVGALPGSPPALVAPEAQPELDARHQRISQMLQSYGLQPLDADQMSTELNPLDYSHQLFGMGGPAVKKKTAAESGLTMGTPAAVKAPVLPSTAQTPVPQTLTADMAAPAAAPVAAPPAATTPTALPTIVPTTQPPREFDYTPESAADMQARIRQESEGREHIFGGTTYVMRNGQLIPKEEERVTEFGTQDLQRVSMGEGTAAKAGLAQGFPTEQGPFKIDTSTGEVFGPAGNPLKMINWETGEYVTETDTRGQSSHLQTLGIHWKDLIEEKVGVIQPGYQQQGSTGGAIPERGKLPWADIASVGGLFHPAVSPIAGLGSEAVRKWFGKQITGSLLSDIGVDFEDGFVKTALGFVGILNPEEQKEVAPEGFDPNQLTDIMVATSSKGQYDTEDQYVKAYIQARKDDLVELADSLGMPLGETRDEWMTKQERAGIVKWHTDAKAHHKKYEVGAAGITDYTAAELKTLTTDELLTNFIDMNADNPTALAGIADHILAAADAKGQIDANGNWTMSLQEDAQSHQAFLRRTTSAQEKFTNAMAEGEFDEAVRQFDIMDALNNAQLLLDSRRVGFEIEQGRAAQAAREAELTGFFQKQTWVYTPATGGSVQVTENVETMEHMRLALLTAQTAAQVAGVTGVYKYQVIENGELVDKEAQTLHAMQLIMDSQALVGEINLVYPVGHKDAGKFMMVEGPDGTMIPATVKTVAQKQLDQTKELALLDDALARDVAFGSARGEEATPLAERNPVLSGLLTGLEGLRTTGSGMDAGAALSHFASNSIGLIRNWLIQKPGGATEADLQVPVGLVPGTNQYETNPDGTLAMRTGSIEEAANYLNGKLNSLAQQGTAITEAQLTRLLPVEPKPDAMSPEGLAGAGATIADQLSAAQLVEDERAEKARLAEEARQFNDSMELQREMMVLEKMQLDTAMQRLYADQRRVEIEDKLARSEIFTNAEQITISKQLADIQQQISDTNKKQMLAELSGMLNDEPTLAGQQFALSKMLAKATATGQITFDGVTQDTLELSRFMWEKDMENKKLELDTARLDQERQIAQQTTTLAENRYALDAAIQVGELQNAVAIRQNTMMVEQQKQLLERDKLRTDTLLALSNPGLMVFVQRYGLLDELGAALGIDFTDEASGGVPTAASMWDTTAYPFPSAQQLKGMSASERQIVLAESAAASDMSLEAGMGAIAGGIPGYQEIQTLTRPTMLTGEAR